MKGRKSDPTVVYEGVCDGARVRLIVHLAGADDHEDDILEVESIERDSLGGDRWSAVDEGTYREVIGEALIKLAVDAGILKLKAKRQTATKAKKNGGRLKVSVSRKSRPCSACGRPAPIKLFRHGLCDGCLRAGGI